MSITREQLVAVAALEEEAARRVAEIMGPFSASAKAIAELEKRRAAGEDAYIVNDGKTWLVGQFLKEAP